MEERIKRLRKQLGLSQAEFGIKIGVKQTTVAGYENGSRTPLDTVIRSICREFNVSYLWLTEGVGEMFLSDDIDTTALLDRVMAGTNETAKALVRSLAKLSDSEWEVIYKVICDVAKSLEQKK